MTTARPIRTDLGARDSAGDVTSAGAIACADVAPTILFVDDEPNVLNGIRHVVHHRRRKWHLLTASDPQEALTLIGTRQIHVLVCDMRMPGMNGAAVLRRAREIAPYTVRLLLTAHLGLHAAVAAVNDGYVFRLLVKPCQPDLLVSALDDALDQYRLVTRDRMLLEAKLEQLSGMLLRVDRLATLGTIAGGIGHELNNVVQAFLGVMCDLEECADAGRPPEMRDLQDLQDFSRQVAVHAGHLLELGLSGTDQSEPIDLCDVVRETTALLREVGKTKRVQVRVSVPSEPMRVVANGTRLEEVFVNLISNAVDATASQPAPGVIEVSLEPDADLGSVRWRVTDNGMGMTEDQCAKIFDPYFTTKPPGKGTGLGLPVVRHLIESYQGSVVVVSKEGEGTTVEILLPRQTD